MRLLLTIALLALALQTTPEATAGLVIDARNPRLRPNEADQTIAIYVYGDTKIQRLSFSLQVEAIPGSNPTVPKITDSDIVGQGTIFYGDNKGQQTEFEGTTADKKSELVIASTETQSGSKTVTPNGVLAYITFDTRGIFSGSYSLLLDQTNYAGGTTFDGVHPDEVRNTTLTVSVSAVPEPSSLVFCGLLASGFVYRRRSAIRKRAVAHTNAVSPR